MSEISLEWFFQIPGLFITVGVLLILIALLVLIIGSSKVRSKKEDVVYTESETQPSVAPINSIPTVNVVEEPNPVSLQNSLNVNSRNVVDNSANVADSLQVSNDDNIMPVGDSSLNIVTPLNVNSNDVTNVIENTPNQQVNPIFSEPIVNQPEVTVAPLVDDMREEVIDNSLKGAEKPAETTVAPIFSQPKVVDDFVELEPVVPVLKTVNSSVNSNLNSSVASNVIEPIIEPVEPTEIKTVQPANSIGINNVSEFVKVPTVETVSSDVNSEIEEIL